jgi:hypothetical protein
VDRIGRAPLFIPRCVLTVGVAVQPDILQNIGSIGSFRGRGLLGRFLFSIPESLVGRRLSCSTRTIDPGARRDYEATIRRLFELSRDFEEAHFSDAARKLHFQHTDDIERRQAGGCDLAGIRDWASKLAGRVARICASLHMASHAFDDEPPWATPIDEATTKAGWAIGEYCVQHALVAFLQMGADLHTAAAKDIIAWMIQDGKPEYSERDCLRRYKTKPPIEVKAALAVLVERGFTREYQPTATGGRPAGKRYIVHPDARAYWG